MRRITAILLTILMPATLAAQVLFFPPTLQVNGVSDTRFEVIEARGAGAMDIWCNAARYAEQALGIPGHRRLYVDRPRGPSVTVPGRIGVVFTTQGTGEPSGAVSVSVRRAGDSLPIHHARQFCRNYILERDDGF